MNRATLRRRLPLLAVFAVLTAGAVTVVGSAIGATPDAGTLSEATTRLDWEGGPFTGSNQTAITGKPDCTVPSSCDTFALTVNTTTDGYAASHLLAIDVSFATTTADFDLYLENSAGAVVGTSATSSSPETLSMPVPANGVYSVVVVPYQAAGDSYTADARLIADPDATGGGGTGTPTGPPTQDASAPTFADYAAPPAFSDADNAGEPSIGDNYKTGAVMYQAGLSTYRATFDDSVSPAAATWVNVSANVTNGCAVGSTESLDPILFTDSATGRTFQSQLTGVDSATCYTDDDGVSWNPSTGGGVPSGVDHQTIGGGNFANGAIGNLPTTTYPNSVYYCSQDIATAFCAASADGGTTFGAGVPTYNLNQCGGLHGHIRVAPDGTAYLPNKNCGGMAAVVVSTDGGLSWTVKQVPGTTAGDSDPSVGIGADGTVYLGYVGSDGKPGMAVSHDRGDTWTDLQTAGTAFGIKNAVFPTVIAGDADRAAFAYVGTPTGGDGGATNVFPGVWHLYVDTTYDGGKTWVTSDATPNDPVQRGSICTAGTTCGNDRNLLDFIDITHDSMGRIEVGFADGCIGACVTDTASTAHDAYATIARQTTGKTLYAKYDPPVTTPTDSPTTTPPTTSTPTDSPTTTPPTTSTPTTTPPTTSTPTTTPPTSTPPTSTPPTTTPPTTTPPTTTPPTNTAPDAVGTATPMIAYIGQKVLLSGSGSSDAESPRGSLTYTWDFGNNGGHVDGSGEQVYATYGKRGYRTAYLTVTDPQGLSDTTAVPVQIARRVDCQSSSIPRHGGWRSVKGSNAQGGSYCDNLGKQKTKGLDSMTVNFAGKGIAVGYGLAKRGGTATMFVDGRKAGVIHFAGPGARPAFGHTAVVRGLSKSTHSLKLVFRGRGYVDYVVY